MTSATHTHTYTHTLTYTHTHTDTQTYPHTHTSLTPRRVLLVMSQRKRRYSTSRSASWCPHPTLICTWATTPWLPPFVAVFCYHCCVLHCAQWLCRYAPIHVVVVGREGISMQRRKEECTEKGKRKEGCPKMESNQKMSKNNCSCFFVPERSVLALSRSRSCSLALALALSLSFSRSLSCIAIGQRGEATIINKRAIKQASFLSDTHLLFSPPNMQAQVVALCSTSPASAPQALNRCRRRRHCDLEGAPRCGSQCHQRHRRAKP